MKIPTQNLLILATSLQILPIYSSQDVSDNSGSNINTSAAIYSVMDAVRDGYADFVFLEEGIRVDFNVPPEEFKPGKALGTRWDALAPRQGGPQKRGLRLWCDARTAISCLATFAGTTAWCLTQVRSYRQMLAEEAAGTLPADRRVHFKKWEFIGCGGFMTSALTTCSKCISID